ncbi:cell division protein ZipA [Cellvibrio mixtus]|uniref:cell division protein ZipA n=1 Tax=Cellvibrio mixtus TaxID=39650 RepID=UPI000586A5C9|nr:cell division protein ZipA [Cellvibrio mixtus]
MKDLAIIIGTILILIILIDGIRRKRNERYGSIKVSRSLKKSLKNHSDDRDDDIPEETPSYTSELPNGGARVIGQRDPSIPVPSIEKKAQAKSFIEKRSRHGNEAPVVERRAIRGEPQQTSLNLGESVPLLMESVEEARAEPFIGAQDQHQRIEPGFSATRDDDLDEQYDEPDHDGYDTDDRYEANEDADDYRDDELQEESDVYTDSDDDRDYDEDQYAEDDYEDQDDFDNEGTAQESQRNLAGKQPAEPEEVLIINVMAHKGEMLNGAELLDVILQCGMRYGSMDIFHRYSDAKGEGALLFSMANMVKPGTFDLDAMDEFETPGVSLFMTLPIDADSMQSFELMVDTAQAIAEGLNGELKDEQRSAMTRQTLEHCRQRIRDFERMRLFRRPPRQ